MVRYNSFEEIMAEGEAKGRVEGEAKGYVEGLAKSILTVLSVRGVAVSEVARVRTLKETDLERLERWLVNAAVATSIEDVFDERDD
jgi:predicted transposase YdaD